VLFFFIDVGLRCTGPTKMCFNINVLDICNLVYNHTIWEIFDAWVNLSVVSIIHNENYNG